MLFDKTVFGPIRSRRFGASLGMNLIPAAKKICTFDCVYCECGWTDKPESDSFPTRKDVREALETKLHEMLQRDEKMDTITFAGNGEPTLHPDFSEIIDDTITLRNQFFPNAAITVLSNSTMLDKESVFEALKRVDNNTMKLDAGTEIMYRRINRCYIKKQTLEHITENLMRFEGNLIVQTLFLRGSYDREKIDNTTKEEVNAWAERIQRIAPRKVLLYPIDRATPAEDLEYTPKTELEKIAQKIEALGIKTAIYD
ncbi:MAG: radical SAM protein [Bacteroidales bacterium]|jgi:wyosine [tRNA(Phe)-imidazoG37] synthetase (radical SAM superfamily)|nr:radical SAM protein [Bacteroidales bacterium]